MSGIGTWAALDIRAEEKPSTIQDSSRHGALPHLGSIVSRIKASAMGGNLSTPIL